MAGTKSASGTAQAKLNGPNINLLMIKSKQAHAPPHSLVKNLIHSAERKNAITSFANGKHTLLKASKKVTTSLNSKTKKKKSLNQPMLKGAHDSLL